MKKAVILLAALVVVLGFPLSTPAALVDMGDGTIYDTTTQLSWLKNANTTGLWLTWDGAVAWAASLNNGSGFAGLTGWRLPTTIQPDSSCRGQNDPGGAFPPQGVGYDCANSEMAHLFYVSLGNKAYCDVLNYCPQAGGGLLNTGPFTNFLSETIYWSGSDFEPFPTFAWYFDFGKGDQYYTAKSLGTWFYAWAVRPGSRTVGAGGGGATPVGYTPEWLVITFVSLTLAGSLLLGNRKRGQATFLRKK
jgi:hypothetical protein